MYDSDAATWSPQGRLHQVEYAIEAIKQGSAAVGLVSNTHAVLVALKRGSEDLGSYQKKVIRIDDHLGIALAGLAPDARVLSNYMRNQALQSKLLYARPLPLSRLVQSLSLKAQRKTQISGARPYGVGLLIIGSDATGPHLWEFLPSGSVLEYRATAIGARSQSARTYLEREFEGFADCTKEELVLHGLKALRECLPQEKELNVQNTSVAVVGRNDKFVVAEEDTVGVWLELLGGETGSTRARQAREREVAGGDGGNEGEGDAPPAGDAMETD